MTSKKYRLRNADQAYLFPPSMRDWLEEEIQELLTKAEAVDQEEDELYGKGKQAHSISSSLRLSPVSRPRESAS